MAKFIGPIVKDSINLKNQTRFQLRTHPLMESNINLHILTLHLLHQWFHKIMGPNSQDFIITYY
jgi:hypothetical protein